MKKWIVLFIGLISFGCIASDGIDFRFDKYGFVLPGNPKAISTVEQVVVGYGDDKKVFIYKNDYSHNDDYGVGLNEFFGTVFSGNDSKNSPELSKLAKANEEGLVKRESLDRSGFSAIMLIYQDRQVIQIHEDGNTQYWVTIESKNMDIKSVFSTLDTYKRS